MLTHPHRTRAVVLVVDDSSTQAQRLAQALEAAGLRVHLAANGREALERARRWRPDVIVSDILMPVMDGFALCRAVRRDPVLQAVPVVLHTITYVDPKDEEFAHALGATRFLVKPADPAGLVREVRAVLAQGHVPAARAAAVDDEAFLRTYSDRLAAKLEDKVRELEESNQRLQRELAERRQAEQAALEAGRRLQEALASVSEREATIRQQAERLRLLNDFARSVSSTLDLNSLFTLIGRHIGSFMPCERCTVARYVAEEQAFQVEAVWWRGEPTEPGPGATVQVDPALTRTLIDAGAPVVVEDPGDGSSALFAASDLEAVRSAAAVPITIDNAVWGILTVAFAQARAVTPPQLEFLSEIAAHLAIGIKNAQLYTDLRAAHTELRAAQEQIVQQERLYALGEMASGIAHDFNNALAPVVGFSELLLGRPEDLADQEKVRRYLELIHVGAADASRVVQRLREFYRPRDDGDLFLPCDLGPIVEQAVALTQPKWKDQALAQGKTIDLVVDLAAVPPVVGNEAQLREVLVNLIFNAVDAIPAAGTITVRTRPGRGAGARRAVLLEVSDTGTGMTEEVRRRCLEPFFSTKGEHGTGLGLSMVYGIVQRHGGALSIESAPGAGTTFRISLAAQTPECDEPVAEGPQAANRELARRLRVLVVDDERSVREVTATLLAAAGHAVEPASSGQEALDKLGAAPFDVVVTDRAMPGMSGDRLALAIKQGWPAMPVLLLTGFGDLMAAAGERPPGVDAVLGKPVTPEKLRRALEAAVAQGRAGAT